MRRIRHKNVNSFEDVNRELERVYNVLKTIPIIFGKGSPENIEYGKPGTLYVDLNGGTSTTLYVKETGEGKSGWIAK